MWGKTWSKNICYTFLALLSDKLYLKHNNDLWRAGYTPADRQQTGLNCAKEQLEN
jgi:hypothetical protein